MKKQLFGTSKDELKSLREKFIIPPFSIIDAKSQYWMDRKHEWERVINDRADNIRNDIAKGNSPYCNAFEDKDRYYGLQRNGKISTFDPFLMEILVKWFSKCGMSIIDPFAGGVVRGAVSKICGRDYWGIDISKSQCLHNQSVWNRINEKYQIVKTGEKNAVWQCGDSEEILGQMLAKHDAMITCPPYYNLEHYTDDPNDLSNLQTYGSFLAKYTNIIEKCYNVLREDSFACIVIEELRDEDGIMRGFVPDTIRAFQSVGFKYYNEMILEQRVVSLKIRCPKYFDQSRKVGRHHQNVLVFYKGDPKNIESKFGKFEEN